MTTPDENSPDEHSFALLTENLARNMFYFTGSTYFTRSLSLFAYIGGSLWTPTHVDKLP
jgi:hypothetical protein